MVIVFGQPGNADWLPAFQRVSGSEIRPITSNLLNQDVIVIPSTYEQMIFLALHLKANSPCKALVNTLTPRNIELLDNKCEFARFIQDQHLEEYTPPLLLMKSASTLTSSNKSVATNCKDKVDQFPCIFKKARSYGGIGSHICYSSREVNVLTAKTPEYLIQEYIEGSNEYSGHFLVENGQIRWRTYYMTQRESNVAYIQKGRMIEYATAMLAPRHEEILKQIFVALTYTGFCCVDFKIHQGKICIFEINPRLGGTLVHNTKDFSTACNVVKTMYADKI